MPCRTCNRGAPNRKPPGPSMLSGLKPAATPASSTRLDLASPDRALRSPVRTSLAARRARLRKASANAATPLSSGAAICRGVARWTNCQARNPHAKTATAGNESRPRSRGRNRRVRSLSPKAALASSGLTSMALSLVRADNARVRSFCGRWLGAVYAPCTSE